MLKAEFMSSEESAAENTSVEQASSSESYSEQPHAAARGKKKLIRYKLPWRSQEMQRVMESLDRKIECRQSNRSKGMCLEVVIGEDSCRAKPDNLPEWATELFS